MKPIQQDDIQDWLNDNSQREFWFIHVPTKKLVKAVNKSKANSEFRKKYGMQTKRADVRQARFDERP